MGIQSEGPRTWKWVFFCGELPKDTWCPTLLPMFKQTGLDHILEKFRREWVRAAFDPQEDLNIPEGVCNIDKIDAR
jgi:hypothetical protein